MRCGRDAGRSGQALTPLATNPVPEGTGRILVECTHTSTHKARNPAPVCKTMSSSTSPERGALICYPDREAPVLDSSLIHILFHTPRIRIPWYCRCWLRAACTSYACTVDLGVRCVDLRTYLQQHCEPSKSKEESAPTRHGGITVAPRGSHTGLPCIHKIGCWRHCVLYVFRSVPGGPISSTARASLSLGSRPHCVSS